MTDQELIRALRWCAAEHDCGCIDCPGEEACDECRGKALEFAADRMAILLWEKEQLNQISEERADACDYWKARYQELLTENAELKKNVATLLAEKSEMGQRIQKLFCEKSNLEREVGRLEVERDHFRDLTKKLWCEKRYVQWVSVDERLPELLTVPFEDCYGLYKITRSDFVLGADDYGNIVIVRYEKNTDGELWWEDENGDEYDIVAWQPLPEPPRTEVE